MVNLSPRLITPNEYHRRQRRLLPLLMGLIIGAALVVLRLGYWQLSQHEVLTARAQSARLQKQDIDARRGRIFDRQGHALVVNVPCVQIEADPRQMGDPASVADKLSLLLDMPRATLLQNLLASETWVVLPYYVPYDVAARIRELKLPGIHLVNRSQRFYPAGSLAAHVLGIVAGDGKGYYGIEGEHDRLLKGVAGALTTEWDSLREAAIAGAERRFSPARDGSDIYLTLDRAVQYVAEEELARAVAEFGAGGGSILVVEARTGYILAMANYPTFDPARFADLSQDQFRNPAVSNQYEPGSVFKLVTMAAALDSGALRPDDSFYCAGEIAIGGRILRPWDRKAHGPETMTEVLIHSCNVGAAYASTKVGAETFYKYVFAFGFAQPTGIELQGEARGKVLLPGENGWYPINLGTNAFGQGLAATPLQMAMAVQTIANGGVRMKPQIVARVVQADVQIVTEPVVAERAIEPETAQQLTAMMVDAVEKEAELARVPGYRIAGKTGTAQIPVAGEYDPRWTIASFAGFLPAHDPQIVILVKLDKPATNPWGSQVAAPVFSRVAKRLVVLLGIPPDGQR